MAFKVKYKFTDDKKFYTCDLTVEQFKNFKELPMIDTCEILKNTKNIR